MLPEMDGQAELTDVRSQEEEAGIDPDCRMKIVMSTALNDYKTMSKAYRSLCDGYLVKPIEKAALVNELRELGVIT
jgi:two-component system, chemotaxis family, chemotaxis protein CheY